MKIKRYFLENTFAPTVKGLGFLLIFIAIAGLSSVKNVIRIDVLGALVVLALLFLCGIYLAFSKTYINCISVKGKKELFKTKGVGKLAFESKIRVADFKIALIRKESITYAVGRLSQTSVSSEDDKNGSLQGLFLVTSKNMQHLIFKGSNAAIKEFIHEELKGYSLRYFYGVVKPGQELKFSD